MITNIREFLFVGIALSGLVLDARDEKDSGMRASRPNIVMIFADDLGWRDVGFMGSKYYETPNIDRLANEGMVFSQAYASAANCAPTRACLISGMTGPRHHVYNVWANDRGDPSLNRLSLADIPRGDIPANVKTWADQLRAAGYATSQTGKWHINSERKGPANMGFDRGGELGNRERKKIFAQRGDPKIVSMLTQNAIDFIEKNQDKPFMMYLSHHSVHTPVEYKEETLEYFKRKETSDDQDNARYAAMLRDFDDSVGLLMARLKELDLDEKTLVIFYSDNGGFNKVTSNNPLRGSKGQYYEGGIRVPLAIRWPGRIRPGTDCGFPVTSVDFFPTFLELADAPVPDQVIDGKSLVPLLEGKDSPKERSLYWHFPCYLIGPNPDSRDTNYRQKPVSVVRNGDWKLMLYWEEWSLDGGKDYLDTNNAIELYNLKVDPYETANLAQENLDRRDALLGDLLAWIRVTNAPVPMVANPYFGDANAPLIGYQKKLKP